VEVHAEAANVLGGKGRGRKKPKELKKQKHCKPLTAGSAVTSSKAAESAGQDSAHVLNMRVPGAVTARVRTPAGAGFSFPSVSCGTLCRLSLNDFPTTKTTTLRAVTTAVFKKLTRFRALRAASATVGSAMRRVASAALDAMFWRGRARRAWGL
jgi:hypothetical protein